MQQTKVQSSELWYTDDPFRSEERLKFIRKQEGTKQLDPIILCECEFEYLSERRRYAIIEGNKRAFVDYERRESSRAILIETDQDLEDIMDRLVDDHGLKKSGARQLSSVVQGYKEWIPRMYDEGVFTFY